MHANPNQQELRLIQSLKGSNCWMVIMRAGSIDDASSSTSLRRQLSSVMGGGGGGGGGGHLPAATASPHHRGLSR